MLPPCGDDELGLLPPSPNPYPATLNEIHQRFVLEAPEQTRERRSLIFEALRLHVAMMRRLFKHCRIWLAGGFVTHKADPPRDADLAFLLPARLMSHALSQTALPLWTLADVTGRIGAGGPLGLTPRLQPCLGLTDSFLVNSESLANVEYWRRLWSSVIDRSGAATVRTKGFVEVVDD
ncbi:DUF6932 family protein [Mycobacterium botniense]|uniref:Uncharacterized protein n=1 Tax=Mycobacterium botniense TaxID=84962 RepID=A0A7I9XTX0_9MYCO|nr:hypothetical protein [Mycobacterium botniense]GFG72727.1 hypothetical protein MBOT_00920 [Mycobacterium botniense]